jgi:hypothetical protein
MILPFLVREFIGRHATMKPPRPPPSLEATQPI